jgi:hypothetical protein
MIDLSQTFSMRHNLTESDHEKGDGKHVYNASTCEIQTEA